MEWIRKGSIPLIKNVHRAIDNSIDSSAVAIRPPSALEKYFNLPPKSTKSPKFHIFHTLNTKFNDPDGIRHSRSQKLLSYNSKTPTNILKALYPPNHSLFMNTKRIHSNTFDKTQRIFQQYQKVNNITMIQPNHLNDLIDQFLDILMFKRPLALLSGMGKPPTITIHGYITLERKRLNLLYQINQIFHDLKVANLPISIKEQNIYLCMNFFRDAPDIQQSVEHAFKTMGKHLQPIERPKFSKDFLKKITRSDPDTLNTLLEISIMNQDPQVFNMLVSTIEDNHSTNRNTLKILCNGYTKGRLQNKTRFDELVQKIYLNHLNQLDITLINEIIKGSIRFDDIHQAQLILNDLINQPNIHQYGNEHSCYRGLNTHQKITYDKYLYYYDEISKVVDMSPIMMIPNIDTFTPFLKYYSEKHQFSKVVEIIDHIELMNLPLTTKSFKICFDTKLEPIERTKLLNKLLVHFNANYNLDYDTTKKPSTAPPSPPSHQPSSDGQYLKLSDDLLFKIVTGFNDPLVHQQYEELKMIIKSFRKGASSKDVYMINQITYMKYGFLKHIYTISLDKLPPLEVDGSLDLEVL